MSSYLDDILIPDQRLVILKALAQDLGYSHNESILYSVLGTGHQVSRDRVKPIWPGWRNRGW